MQIPGAHTGMASLLAKRAGFDAVYVGGSAMTGTMGLPDLGIITIEDVCFFVRQVARACQLAGSCRWRYRPRRGAEYDAAGA